MTIFYPDIAGFQGQINLSGVPAVCAKATQGTSFESGSYVWQQGEAARVGAVFFAYHFLEEGNGSAQANYCFSVVGKTPIMLDWELEGNSLPRVSDAVAFIDRFRTIGGIVNLVYLPHWYWNQIGSPDLSPIISRGLRNVTSEYTSYSDSGPGWNSFGGLPVAVWQYTDSHNLDGQLVDYNAFKGTVGDLAKLVGAASPPPPPPDKPEDHVLKQGDSGPAVVYLQNRLNVWGATLTADGSFGPMTDAAVRKFQTGHKLTVDGVVGPITWAELDKTPPSAKTWHEVVTDGTKSLADFARLVAGTDVVTLVIQTVKHYNMIDPVLVAYLAGLATATVKPTDPIKGAKFWIYS